VAANRHPGSIGTSLQSAGPAGTAGRGCAFRPGPLDAWARAPAAASTRGFGAWVELKLVDLSTNKGRPAQTGTLVRLARASESESRYLRVVLSTPESTKNAAEQLIANRELAVQLREVSGIAGTKLIEWTAQQLLAGEIHVVWRPRTPLVISVEAPPPPAKASPPPRAAAPAPPSPAYTTFPPDLDAALVAQSLIDAAKDGVPFCEECVEAADSEQRAGADQ
jgi:hypothetical protein